MPAADTGVSVYQNASTSVTIDPDAATEHVVNLTGANATTGVSVTLLTPTQLTNMRRTVTIVSHGTGLLTWMNGDAQFPSGVSPAVTSGTTNVITAQYNNVTKKWRSPMVRMT